MKLLIPVAAVVASAAVGSGIAVAVVRETSSPGTTTVITRPLTAVAASPAASTSALSVNQIYRQDVRGIVEIKATVSGSGSGQGGFGSPFGPGQGTELAQGTGFVIDTAGDVVTNAHVVAGATAISVTTSSGDTLKATLVGSDPTTDVAVIKVDGSTAGLTPLAFAASSGVHVGDGVVAIGDPYGLTNTVTTGVVSALGRTINSPNNRPIAGVIQTDAAINHGNSGGPLLNSQGQVIGITSQIYSDGQTSGNVGIGFAVPSNTVRSVASQLLATGRASHAYLGVYMTTIDGVTAQATGLPVGAEITSVRPGSPAQRAGLHAAAGRRTVNGQSVPTGGDVITKLNGAPIRSADDMVARVSTLKAGTSVTLTLGRDGAARTVTIILGSR
jgi:S1-C subfamily serine protease